MQLLTLENCPPCEMIKEKLKRENIQVETLYFYRDMRKNSSELNFILDNLKVKRFPQLVVGEETFLGIDIYNKIKETI